MAWYRVLERSFINNAMVDAGEIVEYDGKASANLELIKKGHSKDTTGEPVETGKPEGH